MIQIHRISNTLDKMLFIRWTKLFIQRILENSKRSISTYVDRDQSTIISNYLPTCHW